MKENYTLNQKVENFIKVNMQQGLLEIEEEDTLAQKLEKTLHFTVKLGDVELVKLLLEQDIDVNTQDKYGDTPLHIAARYKQPQIARLLLEKGADTNLANKAGFTAIQIAIFYDEMSLQDTLIFQSIGSAE